MSNHQIHLDAAKQVCLTALRHLDHGCVVSVKQHSGSVVDEPGEAARIILTLELEALDLPATNNDHTKVAGNKIVLPEEVFASMDEAGKRLGPIPINQDWFKDEGMELRGELLDEAKRRVMDDVMSAKPIFMGRAGRLATGEESGGESLHVVKDSEGEGRMIIGPLEVGVVKVPALTRETLTTIVYSAGLGLLTSKLDAMIDKIMEAQHNARWGDE